MLKLLAFFLLIFFFFRMIGFALRFLLGGFTASKVNQTGNYNKNKPRDGNVNIDYVPGTKQKKGKNFNGGEYVDYEELE